VEADYRIEIEDELVTLFKGQTAARRIRVSDFVRRMNHMSERDLFKDPLPDSVRFVRRRGDHVLVVLELRPQYRQVRWIKDSSEAPYGPRADYQTVRLAFPYVVLFILFSGGNLSNYQQAYYRNAPIRSLKDSLFLSNLRNCTRRGGLACWLCITHTGESLIVAHLPWDQKIGLFVEYFWTRAFNKSPEASDLISQWTRLRDLDPRIGSIENWEKASAEDHSFPLKVEWPPAASTIEEVMDTMLNIVAPGSDISCSGDLVDVINQCPYPEE
jgi:hypothetical protein